MVLADPFELRLHGDRPSTERRVVSGVESRSAEVLSVAVVAACPFPMRRGTPLRIEHLARSLVEMGHRVEVFTYHLGDEGESLPFAVHRIRGAAFYRKTKPGPDPVKLGLLDPLLASLARGRIMTGGFDVIHAHHYEGVLAAAPAARRAGLPLVYDAHTMLESELPTYDWLGGQLVRRIGRGLDSWIPKLADHVVTVTDDIRDALIERHGFAPDDVTTIVNGVELGHFAKGVRRDPAWADRIVYTGTMAGYQGVDLLLRAFAEVLRQRPSTRLQLATAGDFAPFEPLARELGVRHAIELVTDRFADLPQRLADAAVAALPRVHCDGIPQKLLNYMAAGSAVVAFAGSAKVVTPGVDGLVVANDDVSGFARALLQVLDDPGLGARLGAAARAKVEQGYTWPRAAAACVQLYRRLIAARS
jgi:glycosyltransferase involved in cell wall biosynthesis